MRYRQSILSVLGVIFVCALGPSFGARAAGAAVSSQEIPSCSILIESDKDFYYTGETAYFDVRLFNGQESVALDLLEIEAVLRQEEKILPLKEHDNSRGTFSGILEANEENPAIEVTVYRKNRQERTEVLLARKETFLNDIARLRNSRWFLFWKREEIDGEIDQLEKMVEKIESAVEQLNTPLAKRSQSILVLNKPRDDGEEKEGQRTITPHDDGTPGEKISLIFSYPDEDSFADTQADTRPPSDSAETSVPKTGGSSDLAGGPSKKTERISPKKFSAPSTGQPKVVETSSPKGLVPTLTKGQKKSLPKEKISEDVVSEAPKAAPSTVYITPLYSRARDTIPPVTSPDPKKDGTVTNEEARKTLDIPIDKTPPESILDSPADGSMIEESAITINGTVSSDTVEVCGDGVVQTRLNEECDDGNAANGDGCSRDCLREQIVDTTPPSTPGGLSCGSVSTSQTNLSWSVSVDNVGVTGYRVYRNGSQITTVVNTAYQNTGLSASTTYTYSVAAYDAAGNESAQSASVSATTQAPAPVLGDVDGDNDVDRDDLAVVVANLGKVSGFDARADVNKDDKVDIFDLMLTAKELIK